MINLDKTNSKDELWEINSVQSADSENNTLDISDQVRGRGALINLNIYIYQLNDRGNNK